MSLRNMEVQYVGDTLYLPPLEREVKHIVMREADVNDWEHFEPERTCQIDYERHCSNCGVYVRDEAVLVRKDLDDGGWTVVPKPVNYCPSCGAKVVD